MHLGFDAASAVVTAPSSPDRPAEAFRCTQGFVAGDRPCAVRLPGLGILAGRDDSGGTSGGDGIVALAGVKCAICGDTGDLLVGWDLVEKFGQHGRVTNIAARELGCADFQRLFVNSYVDLAPDATFGAAMLAGVPLRC